MGFRPWRDEDLPLAEVLWTDPEVMGYLSGPMTVEEAQARMRQEQQRLRQHGVQYWPVFERGTGEHVGAAGLKPYTTEPYAGPGVYEVGVHIRKPFWSARMGEEAARAVIDFGFREKHAAELWAGHHPKNAHSESLIRRLGFEYVHHEPWGPTARMHPFYRLRRPDDQAL